MGSPVDWSGLVLGDHQRPPPCDWWFWCDVTSWKCSVHALSHPKNPTRQHSTVSCHRCGGKHATKDFQKGTSHGCAEANWDHAAKPAQVPPRDRTLIMSHKEMRLLSHLRSKLPVPHKSTQSTESSQWQVIFEPSAYCENATQHNWGRNGSWHWCISNHNERRYFRRSWSKAKAPFLLQTHAKLHTYTGEPLKILEEITIDVQYGKQSATLPLVVVQGSGPTLLGRDWLQKITLDWKGIHQV